MTGSISHWGRPSPSRRLGDGRGPTLNNTTRPNVSLLSCAQPLILKRSNSIGLRSIRPNRRILLLQIDSVLPKGPLSTPRIHQVEVPVYLHFLEALGQTLRTKRHRSDQNLSMASRGGGHSTATRQSMQTSGSAVKARQVVRVLLISLCRLLGAMLSLRGGFHVASLRNMDCCAFLSQALSNLDSRHTSRRSSHNSPRIYRTPRIC